MDRGTLRGSKHIDPAALYWDQKAETQVSKYS
jgi:hypothetical protein